MAEVRTSTPAPLVEAAAIEMTSLSPKVNSVVADAPAAPSPKEPETKRGKLQVVTIFLALNLALFVAALNDTIVATAIPTISRDLESAAGYVWIGGAYLLASAASAPVWAKFSDIWGRKPIILTALVVFFGASIICGWAVNIQMLIAGRTIQGTAGGGITSLVMIIIADIFSVRARTLFIGFMACTWAVAGASGPILGGAFTQLATWRWCFWLNMPTSGLAFVLLFFCLDVHNPRTKISDGLKAVDWLGSISVIGMVLMILLALNFGGATFPWNSATVICLLVFGVVLSGCFYAVEKWWAKYPVVPLNIFKSWSNTSCFLVVFFQSFVFIGAEFYLPLYFQSVQSATPLRSGILTIPTTIAEAIAAISTGILVHRIGKYQGVMYIATALMTLGTGLFILLNAFSPTVTIIIPQIIAGLGAGALFDPPLIALQANLEQADVASASATMSTLRGIGTAISIVLGGVVFQNGMAAKRGELEKAGLAADLVERLAGAAAAANVEEIALIPDPGQRLAVREAVAASIRNLWIMYTVVAFCALVASLFVRKHVLSKAHTETKTGLKKE